VRRGVREGREAEAPPVAADRLPAGEAPQRRDRERREQQPDRRRARFVLERLDRVGAEVAERGAAGDRERGRRDREPDGEREPAGVQNCFRRSMPA
jgi:hypothetical protein